jgi:hypothetical protein
MDLIICMMLKVKLCLWYHYILIKTDNGEIVKEIIRVEQ